MPRTRFLTNLALPLPAWLSLCLIAFTSLGLMKAQAAEPRAAAAANAAAHAAAITAGRYCYAWEFANNTPQDANDLHLMLAGVTQVGSWYDGSANPFGAPDGSSGYDPNIGAYRANFSGGVAAQGDRVQVGLCADQPTLDVSEASWTVDGAPVGPAPLSAKLRFTQVNPSQLKVEVINSQPVTMTLLAFNLLDGGDGLLLDDLNGQVTPLLSAVAEAVQFPEVLPPGGSKAFELATLPGDTFDPERALVVEAMLAPEDDEGNLLQVWAQMLPPGRQFLPLVRRQ